MSDINKDLVVDDTTSNQADGQNTENSVQSVKDPEAVLAKNRELLSNLQKEKQSKAELMQRIKEIEQSKLQAEGKKDELIAQLQADIREANGNYNKTKAKYALKTVKSQIALKAKELGCIDTEMLTKAMNLEGLQVNIVDDDFNVDEANLMTELDAVRKQKAYLFKQPGPEFRDSTPNTNIAKTGPVDFSKMTTAQIIEMSKKM
jgi:hypothetical protein